MSNPARAATSPITLTELVNGTAYTARVRAYDLIVPATGDVDGNRLYGAWSAPSASFTPAVVPLSAQVTSPTNGASVGPGEVTITATASGTSLGWVEFWVSGTKLGTDATPPYSMPWTPPGPGSYAIVAVANDGQGVDGVWDGHRFPSTAVNVSVPSAAPAWSSGFEASPWYTEWDGSDPTYTDVDRPLNPPIHVTTPAAEGIPTPPDGSSHIMAFPVSATDALAGRFHSKLYKTWDVGAANTLGSGRPGMNGDVSGVYSTQVYWPTARRLTNNSYNERTGLIGWKEIAQNRTIQDSTWWITVVSKAAIDYRVSEGDTLTWLTAQPTDPGWPCIYIRAWNYGSGWDGSRVMALPVGAWTEARAELHENDRVDFYIGGALLDTGQNSVYPVGPQYGKQAGDQWIWEIGNYGGSDTRGVTYFDANFFARF